LKLEGIDDGNAAAALRGRSVRADAAQAVALPPGRYWRSQLVGLSVVDELGQPLGVVEDVVPTASSDLLSLRTPVGQERLLPLVDEFVLEVDIPGRRIVARPPSETE
jgi:16S rRNA processing protein RimM